MILSIEVAPKPGRSLGKPPKKNGKNFTLCVKLWGGGQQNLVCEPQKWVFFKVILAKKRTFLVSFWVKNNGLTKTISLGRKGT